MVDEKYKDEKWLREQYIDKKRNCSDIAEECDVSTPTIYYWQDKFGIDRRDPDWRKKYLRPPTVETNDTGHEKVRCRFDGERKTVYIHQLCAIAWMDENPSALFEGEAGQGKDVHHKNRIPWDNRQENLEVVSRSEHVEEHWEERRLRNNV